LRIALPRSVVSQHFSTSSTSSQRPALWKPSAGPDGVCVNEYLRLGREDRFERGLRDAADPPQRVAHLLLLRRHLRLVCEVLEATAAAGRVMGARRLDAERRRLDDVDGERLREAALHLRHPRAHAVAGEATSDEDDEPVQPRDAVAAVRERVDLELDDVVLAHRGGHRPSVAPPPR
jgi:hypothetical protein